MLRFLSGGESHGPSLVAILEGMPAGLSIDIEAVNYELWRRQQGYGRGNRQKIEQDTAQFIGGLRHGVTTGAPLVMLIQNRDFDNWRHVMSPGPLQALSPEAIAQFEKKKIERFRPGHADLAGTFKYRHKDIRDVLERASARETAARVAAGSVCKQLLNHFGVFVTSHVIQVGNIQATVETSTMLAEYIDAEAIKSELACIDPTATDRMKERITKAWQDGDSLGGVVEVLADGLPVGLGSYTQWDRRLDGQLAQAITSIQAMKAVEIGDGFSGSGRPGSEVHDALYPRQHSEDPLPFRRLTNNAGGIEGGMTNGERLWLRAYMKPIPTMRQGLESVSYPGFKADRAHYERSDVCAIAAASVVCKAMVCLVLANAFVDKFAGDSIIDLESAFTSYESYCKAPAGADNRDRVGQASESGHRDAEPEGNEDAVGEF
jgi:chorismate synthase